MNTKDTQIKILAQAVYELRLLLSDHLGSRNSDDTSEAIAAHLAYAIHNEALAIIEDRPEDFDIHMAIRKIERVDELYGEKLSERFQKLVTTNET